MAARDTEQVSPCGSFPTRTIDELCLAIVDCPHSTPEWTESGVVVLRSRNIRSGRLNLDAQRSYTTDEEYRARTSRAVPQAGDLVITREAPMGEVCLLPPDLHCCLGQRMVLLRPNPAGACGRYLLFALQSRTVQRQIGIHRGTGSTVSNLRIPALKGLRVPCPPLPEQRAIAHVLGTLDDKIELNRRMSETLEAMARTLFKSWFVDFDPVRAKAAGRDPDLPEHLADLFPDRFEESELGEIPVGWRMETVGDIVTMQRESVKPHETPDALFAHYSIPAFDNGRTPALDPGRSIKSTKYRVPSDAVLVSKLNPEIDRVWRPDVGEGEAAPVCSTEFLVLVAPVAFRRSFVYCLARSRPFRERLRGLVTGTSRSHQRVRPAGFLAMPVLTPPADAVRTFDRLASPLLDGVQQRRAESRTLAALRDALLPKLVSGEVRVPDAERFAEVPA